jgi:hypothetical protein
MASNKIEPMARTVHITTPIPTLEEFGKSLGLSKTRQASLLRLVRRDGGSGLNGRHRDASGTIREKATAFRTRK